MLFPTSLISCGLLFACASAASVGGGYYGPVVYNAAAQQNQGPSGVAPQPAVGAGGSSNVGGSQQNQGQGQGPSGGVVSSPVQSVPAQSNSVGVFGQPQAPAAVQSASSGGVASGVGPSGAQSGGPVPSVQAQQTSQSVPQQQPQVVQQPSVGVVQPQGGPSAVSSEEEGVQQQQVDSDDVAPVPVQPQQGQQPPSGQESGPSAVGNSGDSQSSGAQPPRSSGSGGVDCSNQPNGFYYRRACTPNYYMCAQGMAHRYVCPVGLVFDPPKGMCEHAEQCGQPGPPPDSNPPAPPPSFNCNNRPNGHYVQSRCVPNYVVCSGGAAHYLNCPPGLVYDVDQGQCEHQDQCGRGGSNNEDGQEQN